MTLQSSPGSSPAQRAFAHNALLISCPPLCHPSTSMTSEALMVHTQSNIFFSTLFQAPVSTIRMWISLSLKMSLSSRFWILRLSSVLTLTNTVLPSQSSILFCLSALPCLTSFSTYRVLITNLLTISSLSILLSLPVPKNHFLFSHLPKVR